jgi:hypothetical protein
MFTYSDNTNYNLNFYYFIVSIWDFIYSAIIHVSDVSDGNYSCVWCQWWQLFMCLMSVMEFCVLSTVPITAPSFDETMEFALSVAMVDTHRVLQARETTARECTSGGHLAWGGQSRVHRWYGNCKFIEVLKCIPFSSSFPCFQSS